MRSDRTRITGEVVVRLQLLVLDFDRVNGSAAPQPVLTRGTEGELNYNSERGQRWLDWLSSSPIRDSALSA